MRNTVNTEEFGIFDTLLRELISDSIITKIFLI